MSTGPSDRCLIFVHGRDFKPAADDMQDISVAALTAGLERDHPDAVDRFHAMDKCLAYYGDLTNQLLSGRGEHFDEKLDVGDRRNALSKLRSLDRKKHFGVSRYDRLPGKTAIAEFAADIAAPLLGSIGLSKKLISSVAKDLAEYWSSDSDFASQVRERVRETICAALDRSERVMVMSHGTGSIVTYDVLWQLSHDPEHAERYSHQKIEVWLTLGAPLGDSMVRRRLLGTNEKGRARFPSNVVSWHNVSAEDDYLSHDNTLADDYKAMLKQKQVSCIRDYRIYNLAVRYGKSNPHSSIGYLIHPRTAQVIADWLQHSAAGAIPAVDI